MAFPNFKLISFHSGDDMKTIFAGDFSQNGSLVNWTREQHVPDGYLDFTVKDNSLVFLDAGNRLLPHVTALHDFRITGVFDIHWEGAGNIFDFRIHFDYDPYTRKGKSIEITSDGKELIFHLKDGTGKSTIMKGSKKLFSKIIKNKYVAFAIEKKNESVALSLNLENCFSVSVGSGQGVIALERGHFVGDLNLKKFEITAENVKESAIWKNISVPFAPLNGMGNPIVWTLSATKIGECIRLDVTLSGGVKDRERIPWYPYHGTYGERLDAPYLRIETPSGECIHLCLTEKHLLLKNPLDNLFFMSGIGHEKPEWPLEKTFYPGGFDFENAVLFCGYERYVNKAISKHLAGGPTETVYSCVSGKIVYAGATMPSDSVAAELKSQEDKKLCTAIPKAVRRRAQAVAFARRNHFFMEKEACRFHFEVISRRKDKNLALHVEYSLLNAFFEPVSDPKKIKILENGKRIVLDIEKFESPEFVIKGLKAGVYHIAFKLFQGNRLLLEKWRAFEVMSDGKSGPQASNLPRLYSTPTEVMGVDTNEFDPWLEDISDVSHYISTAAGIMPHIAEEQRVWDLYKLYRREWFLWLTPRTAGNPDFKLHREAVEKCDFIAIVSETQKQVLMRICCRGFYTGPQLEILYEFAEKNDFHPEQVKKFIRKQTIPDLVFFKELVEKHFYEWMDFFNAAFLKDLRAAKNELAKVNPNAKLANYGPAAMYPAAYKTAHSCQYTFSYLSSPVHPVVETGDIYDGFFNFADLTHCCRYSINRGPFMAASVKLEYEKVKIHPEMYTPNEGEICPDAAVARAWPSVGMWGGENFHFPVSITLKRVLEYVFASIHHDGKNFRYWNDYGFHSRTWERERYEGLLRLWGFIDKHKPARPLRGSAFLCSEECCLNHEVFYDEYGESDLYTPYGDLFNTAEESSPYAYEMSRKAGMNAGFVVDFKSLDGLTPDDLDILVLPPLTKVCEKDLKNIRRLHEAGVSLLAFEEVGGLEDLFGVKSCKVKTVRNIRVNQRMAGNPLAELAHLEEYTEHRACKGKYRANGAEILLDGEIPVLFTHQTKWGKTGLYNIPPTVVRREDQFNRVAMGRDSISPLINESTCLLMRHLSRAVVETRAGKIIGFEDVYGGVHVIVEEDAHPMPAKPVEPLVTIHLPGLKNTDFSCSKEFSVVELSPDCAKLRFYLKEDEFAILSIIKKQGGRS